MREADVAEVWAAAMLTPREALETSLNAGGETWTIAAAPGPVAMGGVTPPFQIWLLGTDWITENGLAFNRAVKPKLQELLGVYGKLYNYVHDRNVVAKRWLEKMGFALEPAEPYGVRGELFHYVSICHKDIA